MGSDGGAPGTLWESTGVLREPYGGRLGRFGACVGVDRGALGPLGVDLDSFGVDLDSFGMDLDSFGVDLDSFGVDLDSLGAL